MPDDVPNAIAEAWRVALEFDDAFRFDGVVVKVREIGHPDGQRVRVVRLAGSTAVSVPAGCAYVPRVRDATDDLTDVEALKLLTGSPTKVVGPVDLLCIDSHGSLIDDLEVETVAPNDVSVAAFLSACNPNDVEESSVGNVVGELSIVRIDGDVVAAAGWQLWVPTLAHMCVLTHPSNRGQQFGRRVASHATRRAIKSELTPQWRCLESNLASRSLAISLGYRTLGKQVVFRF